VDLARRFITVKTAKTGQTISIPIFPLLLDELSSLPKSKLDLPGGKELVFPEQAAMYEENPDGITWRVKKVLAVALGEAGGLRLQAGVGLPEVTEEDVRGRGHDFIAGLPESEKKRRMLAVFDAYMDGKKMREIVTVAGVSKGSVSGYLNEIEGAVGCRIVRGRPAGGSLTAALKSDDSLLRVKRTGSKRRASVRDFHSFRVTWVTLALTQGVPLELVQKVTGHKTTDVVLKHYFRPGQEDFRRALEGAMPKLLTVGTGEQKSAKVRAGLAKAEIEVVVEPAKETAKEEMRALIATVRPGALRERMLKVWAKL